MLCGCVPTQPTQHGIPNFGIVPGGYRGGQPKDWTWIKSHAAYDINLSENDDPQIGIAIVNIPISSSEQIFGGQKLAVDLTTAVEMMGWCHLNHQPFFVHCEHGANRTGSAVWAYRAWILNESQDQCRRDAISFGWGNSFSGLKRFCNEEVPRVTQITKPKGNQ